MTDRHINGLNVVVSSYICRVPKVSLSGSFRAASEGCIRDMNAWLREMFGTMEESMLVGDSTIVVGPELYSKLMRAYNGEGAYR